MTNVVFVAPYLMAATARFVRAAAQVPGAQVVVVTHEPADAIDAEVAALLVGHWRVDDALDVPQLTAAVDAVGERLGGVDRLVAVLEQLQEPVAAVRERLSIPGMGPEVARRFRDKAHMKDVLRAAGVPCARHRLCHDADEARGFVAEAGLPVVVKPPDGAGANATFRVDEPGQLQRWLAADPPRGEEPVLLEEFLVGEEHSFDSVWVDGEMRWWSVTRYLPTPLEVLSNAWMQWVVLAPRHVDVPEYAEVAEVGAQAVRALGLGTGMAHLEWFRRPDGSVAVSEVAARPPGAQLLDATAWACGGRDLYADWTRLVIDGGFDPPARTHAAGVLYLRGQLPGGGRPDGAHVAAVHNVERLQDELGHLVVEARLPQPGASPAGTYTGDGHVIVRADTDDEVVAALARLTAELRVELA